MQLCHQHQWRYVAYFSGLQARKTQMHVPWEILVLAVTVVVLVVIFASIKWLWYRNSE